MGMIKQFERWAIKWRSENKLDGKSEHFIFEQGKMLTFVTRREARAYKKARFGYISERRDLQIEPHGWKPPKVVKAMITITEL